MLALADRLQATLANPRKFAQMGGRDTYLARHLSSVEASFAQQRVMLRSARRFSLSDQFVQECVYNSPLTSTSLLSRISLASLPFDQVWVEFDQNTRIDAQVKIGTTSPSRKDDLGRSGILFTRYSHDNPDSWIAFAFTDAEEFVFPHFTMYDFSVSEIPSNKDIQTFITLGWGFVGIDNAETIIPNKFDDVSQVINVVNKIKENVANADEDYRNNYLSALNSLSRLGRTLPNFYLLNGVNNLRDFNKHKSFFLNNPFKIEKDSIMTIIQKEAIEMRGDLRFFANILAMINYVPTKEYYIPSKGRFTHKLKTMDYLSYNIVNINAGKQRISRILERSEKKLLKERQKHRRHEVRGHWRVLHPGTPKEKRIYIDWHMRGDASLGYVRKEYEVYAKSEQVKGNPNAQYRP